MSEVVNNNSNFLLSGGANSANGTAAIGSVVRDELAPPRQAASSPETDSQFSLTALLGLGRHYLLALGLSFCYLLFFCSLLLTGQLYAEPAKVSLLFFGWLTVSGVLVRGLWLTTADEATKTRTKVMLAIWCNVGVVATATLVGGDMRLLLLVGVVFGLLYAGLHFSETRVRSVLLATLLAYAGCVALKSMTAPWSPEFELFCASGLAVLLLASSLIARETIRLRLKARVRNRRLAQALRRVEELALRDELTGLYNRRHLLDFVGRAIAARERGGPSFALAYCDLDHFKRVNDRFGHECGDRLLQGFAQAASSSVRANDLVARLGGEEFVLVLVDADESEACDIVERLRMRTSRLRVSSAEPSYKVTLSSGLATYTEDDTVDSLLRRADEGLYSAKEQGRDRLVRA